MAIRVDRFLIDRAANIVRSRRRDIEDPKLVDAIEGAYIDLFAIDIDFSAGLFRLACRPTVKEKDE